MNEIVFYIQQGFTHVLDLKALDHVLLFVALTVVYRFKNWKKTLWLITFFTLGHGITFGLSVYEYLDINVDLVEFLIAVTILISVLINIFNVSQEKEIQHTNANSYFAFLFGLIHGLGFSNYFKMLLDDDENKFIPLIEFAIGIEFSQIVIVLLVLSAGHVFQYVLHKKRRYWIIGVSILLLFRVIPMLFERFPF
ncbi:MAG: HupE/UreJ family protein [Flavobacteriaceae bacterium]